MSEASGACVWLTGRRGAGTSTVARLAAEQLRRQGVAVALLDDDVPARLAAGPDGSGADALAWLVGLLTGCGVLVVVAADLPTRDARERARAAATVVVEVFVDTPAGSRAARGADPGPAYEEPLAPDLRVLTHDRSPAASAAQVVSHLEAVGLAGRGA